MIDTTQSIETPEGAILELRMAGPVVRSLAWLIDFFIRAVVYIVVSLILKYLDKLGSGIMLLFIFLLEWFYPVFFEIFKQGATPGKKIFGLKVLHDTGIPVGWSASIARNLLRAADFLPVLYGCGLMSMLLNRDFKRLGDIAAQTVVVYENSPRRYLGLPSGNNVTPEHLLKSEEQQLLINFALRSPYLTPERVNELAAILHELTPAGVNHTDALLSYARYYAGQYESA
ncbi:MAG: RDD family protein [Pseudomonadota bacterium]